MNRKLLGKHINSPESKSADWTGEWPIIDSAGIITGSYDGDCVPDNAILVDWNSNNPDNAGYTVVSGENGFEAVLE